MASVAKLFEIYFVFSLISPNTAGTHLPPIDPKLVDISDHRERRGFIYEDKHVKEVIVEKGLDHLHLVCEIEPALPFTEEHFRLRNDLVKFEKLYPEHYVVPGKRYWSDNQQKTAVAMDTGSVGLFGTYSCTYGNVKQTVEVLAENIDVLKDLPAPKTLEEMFSLSFVKNNSVADTLGSSIQAVVKNKDFICHEEKSKSKPTSVHMLTPSDIDVVATLGDSIMVGLGTRAVSLPQFFTEYRGISWSNGGDSSFEDTATLPNILKRFNPRLKGYSSRNGRHYDRASGLNIATVSSTSRDLQDQVKDLVDKIKFDKTIDLQNDWKLVTIMIGSRDLCRMCDSEVVISPDEYIKLLMKALDTLQAELPRTFVNLILPLNVSSLNVFHRRGDCLLQNCSWQGLGKLRKQLFVQPKLGDIHRFLGLKSICPCVEEEFMRKKISDTLQGYKRLVYELVGSGVYDRTEDFTVVIQPLFENLSFSEQDRDSFSLDCLHFSAKGNAFAATSLWNNMVEPIEKKRSQWSEEPVKCPPKESPYFFTYKNSEAKMQFQSPSYNGHAGKTSTGVIAATSMSIVCALAFVFAFIFLKHKLNTPVRKLHFSDKPWLKYGIKTTNC